MAIKKKIVKAKNNDKIATKVVVEKKNYGETETLKDKEVKGEQERTDSGYNTYIPKGRRNIGLSKGLTINLGNYESARIDCFMSMSVEDTEDKVLDGLMKMSQEIDEQIMYEQEELNN